MNIWILNHYASTMFVNSGGRHYWFSKYLIKNGNSPSIFCSNIVHETGEKIPVKGLYKEEKKDNIDFFIFKTIKYRGNTLSRLLNIFSYFINVIISSNKIEKKRCKPDIIYASSVHPLTCVAGILLARRYKVRCICEIRDMWPFALIQDGILNEDSIITKLLYKLEHWIYKNCDSLIFTMEGGKDYITDKNWESNVHLNKIYNINNGVDLNMYKENIIKNTVDDKDLLDNSKFKIIYTGAIRQSNGINNIVKIAEELESTEYKDKIIFLIYGEGTEKLKLEDYCKKNNINNLIFKGRVNKKYIPYILSKSDLNLLNYNIGFCKALKYGGSQNKLFEYCASGRPVLSNSEMNYNLIEKYNCGKCANINSINSMIDIILEFYHMNEHDYNKYCMNSKKLAEDYDYKILTEKLESVINNTIGE